MKNIKKPLIIANLKMNMNIQKMLDYTEILEKNLPKESTNIANVVLVPPFTLLKYCVHLFKSMNMNIFVGSQNFFYEDNGPYTGEISAKMLEDINIKYALVGHSERRIHFSESDEMIQKKVEKALEYNINPILCIGENIEDKTLDLTEEKLATQLKVILKPLINKNINLSKLCIAYEPIWAIGLEGYLDIQAIQKPIQKIKEILSDMEIEEASLKNISILYGGAVNDENIHNVMKNLSIDGILIGRAALDPIKFMKCIELFLKDYYL